MSLLNRFSPTHFSQVNRYLTGVYYISSLISEVSPWYILDGKVRRLASAFANVRLQQANVSDYHAIHHQFGFPKPRVWTTYSLIRRSVKTFTMPI